MDFDHPPKIQFRPKRATLKNKTEVKLTDGTNYAELLLLKQGLGCRLELGIRIGIWRWIFE